MPIALLSARDEAHLGFVGATCDRAIDRGTLIDIGGGSTELTRIENGQDFANVSIPQGSLSSYAQHVAGGAAHAAGGGGHRAGVLAAGARPCRMPAPTARRASTASGEACARPPRCTRRCTPWKRARARSPRSEVASILDLLQRDPGTFAHQAVKAVPERVHTLVPGCLIAHALLTGFGADALEICKYGLREGYLMERMLAPAASPRQRAAKEAASGCAAEAAASRKQAAPERAILAK